MPEPLREADILFPYLSGTPNFSTTLSSVRQSTLSIHNRLSSIVLDSEFVTSVAEAYGLPLVANERCGSWYIPPALKFSSTYFKSTDGHMGEWGFSLRRLNMQLLDVVAKRGGAVVVDSTRRGKSMPDALSKTVPIWCCVINRATFGSESPNGELFTPPSAVSKSEHAQIEKRIDGFVKQFLEICRANILDLRSKLLKPLRPLWVTQASSLPSLAPEFTDFHPIVLCTASRRVDGAEASENGYIQGAADDQEAWANGLTPEIFWNNKDLIMSTNKEEVPSIIAQLLQDQNTDNAIPTLINPTKNLYISTSHGINSQEYGAIISCTPEPLSFNNSTKDVAKNYLHIKTRPGKLGSRDLRTQLPQLTSFLTSFKLQPSDKVLVCCPTGKDLSVGTVLAILCLFADEQGVTHLEQPRSSGEIDKILIKKRLTWITTSNPALNPSRATLQSVNAVLLESQDPKARIQSTTKDIQDMTLQEQQRNQKHTMSEHTPTAEPAPAPAPASKPEEEAHPSNDNNSNPNPNNNNSPPSPPPNPPSSIFTTLLTHHPWSFTRTLRSALPTHPSGTVTGTATFTPCTLGSSFPSTLLYAEEGEFVTNTGLKFTARRKYVYQLKTDYGDDSPTEMEKGVVGEKGMACDVNGGRGVKKQYIAVHFFDDEAMPRSTIAQGVGTKGEGIGGLFVEMGELSAKAGKAGSGDEEYEAVNKEQHLCAEDLYTAMWKFGGGMIGTTGVGLEGSAKEKKSQDRGDDIWWEVRYDVKGPKKDYTSTTRYVPSSPSI